MSRSSTSGWRRKSRPYSGGEDERADGRGPHRARDGDGDDGLHVARAGAGAARRSPLGPLLLRGDPVRDAVGQEGVQAGHGERHDRGDHAGRAAGADAVGPEHLAGSRPHRQALPGEGPENAVPVREGRRLRALGGVEPDDDGHERRARHPAAAAARRRLCDRRCGGRRRARRGGSLPLEAAAGRAPPRPAASSASRCCRSRTWALPRTTTSPTGSRMQIRGKLTSRAGPRGHRAGQLDALQEDDQDAAGDRPGARRALSADGDGALAEERRRQPRAGQPGARRDHARPERRHRGGSSPSTRRSRMSSRSSRTSRRRWRRRWAARSRPARRSGFRRSPRRTSPPTTPS